MSDQEKRVLGQQVQTGKKRAHTTQINLSHIDPEYVGTFRFHHPTVIERMQVGVLKSQMLQGLEGKVDIVTDNIAHMTATLNSVLDSSPDWFDPNNLYDYEVLDAVYDEYIRWYNSFRRQNKENNDAGNSEGSTK